MLKKVLLIFVTFVVLDLVYFSYAIPNIYKPGFGDLLVKEMTQWHFVMAMASWLLLALGLALFVRPLIRPGIDTVRTIAAKGALYGLVVYGVYNATNLATIEGYKPSMAMADLAWGSFVSAAVSVIHFRNL